MLWVELWGGCWGYLWVGGWVLSTLWACCAVGCRGCALGTLCTLWLAGAPACLTTVPVPSFLPTAWRCVVYPASCVLPAGEGEEKYLIATSEQTLCAMHRKDWMDKSQVGGWRSWTRQGKGWRASAGALLSLRSLSLHTLTLPLRVPPSGQLLPPAHTCSSSSALQQLPIQVAAHSLYCPVIILYRTPPPPVLPCCSTPPAPL